LACGGHPNGANRSFSVPKSRSTDRPKAWRGQSRARNLRVLTLDRVDEPAAVSDVTEQLLRELCPQARNSDDGQSLAAG